MSLRYHRNFNIRMVHRWDPLRSVNSTHSPSYTIVEHTGENPKQSRDILSREEREIKEMEWLVRTSEKYLHRNSPSGGGTSSKDVVSRSQCRRVHNLMKAWGARRTEAAPLIVDKLFQYLQENAPHSITTQSYNLRLDAWAARKDAQSITRCSEILNLLKEHKHLQPNVHSYNACIKSWIRGARHESVDKVEQLLGEMHDVANQTGNVMMLPNRRSYNLLLYGLAHSNSTSIAALRALEIFEYLKDNPAPFCKPNANSFHQLMLCLARDDQSTGFEDRLDKALAACLDIAKESDFDIYADTFNVYMGGWLKSRRSVGLERIEAALCTMERLYAEGHKSSGPNCITMNTVLAAYIKFAKEDNLDCILRTRKRLESTYALTPDTTTFNTLIDAHTKSRRATADISALSLLQIMERHLVKNKKRAKPDSYTYCAVIDCLAKTNPHDAGLQAEQVLRRMIELHINFGGEKPTLAVYNSVLNAMAVSSPGNLTAAKNLLSEMEDRKEGSMAPKPDIIAYNSALKAALRSGRVYGAQWADELLQSLESKAKQGGSLGPDSFSYTTVIAAYARSKFRDKVAKAVELVDRAILLHLGGYMKESPGVSVFNAACNACCFADGDADEKRNAFTAMMGIRDLLTAYTQADETSYGTLLRGCSQLLQRGSTKQDEYVRQLFREACERGLCGNFVLKQMRFAASPETYRELLGFDIIVPCGTADLPHAWSRNVMRRRRR